MGFVIKWDIGGVIDKLRRIGPGMKQEAKPVVVEAEGEDSIGSMEGASEQQTKHMKKSTFITGADTGG